LNQGVDRRIYYATWYKIPARLLFI